MKSDFRSLGQHHAIAVVRAELPRLADFGTEPRKVLPAPFAPVSPFRRVACACELHVRESVSAASLPAMPGILIALLPVAPTVRRAHGISAHTVQCTAALPAMGLMQLFVSIPRTVGRLPDIQRAESAMAGWVEWSVLVAWRRVARRALSTGSPAAENAQSLRSEVFVSDRNRLLFCQDDAP